ncbi:tRNA methyltransferase [Trypanosoma rangeli]|uniref:tRNA methyltransferase n=1 Tax=Trypanosoma rangeli TaxID=5698 RepID=A0A422ND22_TRYRA|nr:tRNA methyltransferase [Trypanosoma rangeli]RNF03371.1 tRNA methyltransferase [Trypanosoma rangeli]|eukprot:RNF03371.1 tRNA methyltransferase [Trypanosoma rangeli]
MADATDVPPAQLVEGDALEREHVLNVYNAIATHFSSTRYKAWPKVQAFIEALPKYALVADVGCGNGKYFGCAQRYRGGGRGDTEAEADDACRYVVGIDVSEGLLRLAQRQLQQQRTMAFAGDCACRTDLLRADGRCTALRGGIFDAVVSIAVVHHFATHARRVEALRELLRLVRRDGVVLVSVWAKEQPKKRSRTDAADVFVRWEMHENHDKERRVYQRYYHLFAQGELESLATEAGASVRTSYYDKENWCAILTPA